MKKYTSLKKGFLILGALLVVAGIVLGVFYYLSTRPEVKSRTYLRRYEYDKLRDLYEKTWISLKPLPN